MGAGLFAAVALFAVGTLPEKLDAARRAKYQVVASSLLNSNKVRAVNAMPDAPPMTYLAAGAQTIWTLLDAAILL